MESRKVIWVINQFAGTPESGWGERHYFLARYWKQQGYRVIIFSGSYNHMFNNLPITKGTYTVESVNGIEFCWIKVPKYEAQSIKRFWSMLVFAFKAIWIKTSKFGIPDTIIVSSLPIFPIASALIKKLIFKNVSVIFEIRDIWPLSLQYLAGLSSYHPAVVFIGWFERIGYKYSDKIVSLLPNAREHMERVAGKKLDLTYIPNGIEEELLNNEPLPRSVLELIPKEKFIIGYTGTIARANALAPLIEVVKVLDKENKDIHFVMVGDGYLKKSYQTAVDGCNNITFIPKIKKNQVQSALCLFDVCFVSWNDSPLYHHGVSANKYFDYMLAKKPILDANNFIKDPVEISECGVIVKPDSVEALYNGILAMYSLPKEQLISMGEKGYKYVREVHSIQKLADKYLTVL